jgi:hydroxymethylbilane synthase
MRSLTVATRGSRLALAQTEIVITALKSAHPDIDFKINTISTKGDRAKSAALWQLNGFGFFTRQVEEALLGSRADLAVHSFKDMPTEQIDGLTIAAVCQRDFPEDCLISSRPTHSLDDLPAGAKIGTSSFRRIAQIRHLRGDLTTAPIRGNVETRLAKLEAGQIDAVVLARAGLERLRLAEKISFSFDPQDFIPAPAQGALAVQTRADDAETTKLVASIDHEPTRLTVLAERKVLAKLHPGCHAPVGIFARIIGSDIMITGFVANIGGSVFLRREVKGPVADSKGLAQRLADELIKDGAANILGSLRK